MSVVKFCQPEGNTCLERHKQTNQMMRTERKH